MRIADETFASLDLWSETLPPEDIQKKLGIAADKSWRKGDPMDRTGAPRPRHYWALRAKRPGASVDVLRSLADEVTGRLAPKMDVVRQWTTNGLITVNLYFRILASQPPGLLFDRQTIDRIHRMGASLEIDIHLSSEST